MSLKTSGYLANASPSGWPPSTDLVTVGKDLAEVGTLWVVLQQFQATGERYAGGNHSCKLPSEDDKVGTFDFLAEAAELMATTTALATGRGFDDQAGVDPVRGPAPVRPKRSGSPPRSCHSRGFRLSWWLCNENIMIYVANFLR